MSTCWYYECLDHEPPIRSTDEFTQHTDDRHYESGIGLIGQRPVTRDDRYFTRSDLWRTEQSLSEAYFRMNATTFLADHPTCRIGLVNEYGERTSP